MTKVELWEIYVRKNPGFTAERTITMTTIGLKKLFDTTWEMAESQGFENGKAWIEMVENVVKTEDVLPIFKEVFGKK